MDCIPPVAAKRPDVHKFTKKAYKVQTYPDGESTIPSESARSSRSTHDEIVPFSRSPPDLSVWKGVEPEDHTWEEGFTGKNLGSVLFFTMKSQRCCLLTRFKRDTKVQETDDKQVKILKHI